MDNLNTHEPESFYETFPPEKAKAIWSKFEFVYTPKHGSWLNMAEIELNVLTGQCLDRRIDDIEVVRKEVGLWCLYLPILDKGLMRSYAFCFNKQGRLVGGERSPRTPPRK